MSAPESGPRTVRPALFAAGFRPFMLAGAAWAALALAIWLAVLHGAGSIGGAHGALAWHAHEMLYGFGAAVLGGFLLTAVPTWTGRAPPSVSALAALLALWIAGRAAMAAPAVPGLALAAAVDLAFLAALAAFVAVQVTGARLWRNLPVVAALVLLLAGNALAHAEVLGLAPGGGAVGRRLALALFALLVALIGGRIVPAFTRNWLLGTGRGEPLPAPAGRLDAAVLVATAAALAAWVAAPAGAATGVLAAAAATGNALRLARWRGWRTGGEPLVWILHLGYAWLPIGLALAAGAALAPGAVPAPAVVHALGSGLMATMMLAMMTRVTLGHTGRALAADRTTTAIYAAITAAALARVAAPWLPELYMALLTGSGVAWLAAFALFLVAYAPKLCAPRVDRLAATG